jgi:hypothetical protein
MNGARAIRLARGAKIAAATLVLAAVGLAVGVPGLGDRPIAKPQIVNMTPPVQAPQSATTSDAAPVDTPLVIADRLELGRKKPPAKAETERHEAEEIPVGPPMKGEWKFLGMIREPDRDLAIISVDGAQTFVPVGWKIDKDELVAMTNQEITVRREGVERTIAKSDRTGGGVSWVKMASNTPPAAVGPNVGAGPGGAGGASPADMAARMRERGIDPAQAQKMREFFRDQRGRTRGGGPGGEGTGNGFGPRNGNEPFLNGQPGVDTNPNRRGGQR